MKARDGGRHRKEKAIAARTSGEQAVATQIFPAATVTAPAMKPTKIAPYRPRAAVVGGEARGNGGEERQR